MQHISIHTGLYFLATLQALHTGKNAGVVNSNTKEGSHILMQFVISKFHIISYLCNTLLLKQICYKRRFMMVYYVNFII